MPYTNHSQTQNKSIRKGYEEYDIQGFYQKFGDEYRNPQELSLQQILQLTINSWHLNLTKVLDLACGSGEVTITLQNLGYTNIDGIDPYTYNAYFKRTGKQAEIYSFEEISAGIINNRSYSLIVCSFALHLLSESRLPTLLYQLSLITDSLLIITPHKRPDIKPEWGWNCVEEMVYNRVRARLYKCTFYYQKE